MSNLKVGDKVKVIGTCTEYGVECYPIGYIAVVLKHPIGVPYLPFINQPANGMNMDAYNKGHISNTKWLKKVDRYKRNLPIWF